MIRYLSGMRWCLGIGLVGLVLFLGACGVPVRDAYLSKGVDRVTQDDVRAQFGAPHTAKTPVLGGDTVWTYRVSMSEKDLDPSMFGEASQSVGALVSKPGEGPKPTLYCYRYTLTFNEQKILKAWKREECVPGTRSQLLAQ